MQSAHNRTLEAINRGHTVEDFSHAVDLASTVPALRKCIHLILGLPGESLDHYRQTLLFLNSLPVHGLKLHHLQIVKNTIFAREYTDGKISAFDESQYIDILSELLPVISSKLVIHRLFGDIHSDYLIAPRWKTPKTRLIQQIESRLRTHGLYQGSGLENRF